MRLTPAAGQAYPPARSRSSRPRRSDGFFEADLGAVRTAASAGVRLAREAGDLYGLEMMLLNLGSAALIAGDLDESKPLLAEALRIARQIDDRVAQFYLLDALRLPRRAFAARPRLAARLLGAADTVRTEAGANLMPFLAPLLARAEESAATALGAARFQAGFEAGKRLDRDTALDLALGEHRSRCRRLQAVPAPGRSGSEKPMSPGWSPTA